MSKLSERGVVHLLLPLILVLGLIAGVYLVTSSNPLKLFSRATSAPVSPPISPYVCGVYFRKVGSPRMIQGTYTNDSQATSSIRACYDWLKNNLFNKPNCAQPNGEYATGVLMQNRKFTSNFDMPSINMSTEFVANQHCPTSSSARIQLFPPSNSPTPNASGEVRVDIFGSSKDNLNASVSGSLRNVMPNTWYNLNVCRQDVSCGLAVPLGSIQSDASGSAVFQGLSISTSNPSNNPITSIRITTYRYPPLDGQCYDPRSPCLMGNFIIERSGGPITLPAATPMPVSCTPCGADADKNGSVGIIDMMRVAQCTGKKLTDKIGKFSCQAADANGDGKINTGDLNCTREQFGKQCSGPRR